MFTGLSLIGHDLVSAQIMPSEPAFSPSAVASYRDSFAIHVRGQERGSHVFVMERLPDGFRYGEVVVLGAQFHRTLEVLLGADLKVRSSHSEGQAFGQPMGGALRYEGQHVTGRSWVRHGQEPAREEDIDALLPPLAFDGHALMGLIGTLAWLPRAEYALTMFDADENSLSTQRLRITGPERITVPAGSFEVYRGDLTTTQAPVRIWVTAQAPHRLVKIGGATDDFITVLVAQHPGMAP